MDKRAFTGTLLSQLADQIAGGSAPSAPPAPSVSPSVLVSTAPPPSPGRRVLVVTDLPEGEAIGVLQEAYALRRFGLRVEAMIPADAMTRLARYAQPGTLLDLQTPPAPQVWEGLETVLAVPSQDLLARMALGLQDRPAAGLILQALWRGTPVWMDFSCTSYSGGMECANPAMAAFYQGYAAQLRTLGARPVAPGEYLIALRGQGSAPQMQAPPAAAPVPPAEAPPAAAPAPVSGPRVVITRQDLLSRTPDDGVWLVPAGALVTPLARDTAKKLGLELRPEGPSSQPGRNE